MRGNGRMVMARDAGMRCRLVGARHHACGRHHRTDGEARMVRRPEEDPSEYMALIFLVMLFVILLGGCTSEIVAPQEAQEIDVIMRELRARDPGGDIIL